MKSIKDVIERVRAEYIEMPGLRLRAEQVQRLCGIEQKVCRLVLDTLVHARFLSVNPDGQYRRSADGAASRLQSARRLKKSSGL
jgi:hypothetical protein